MKHFITIDKRFEKSINLFFDMGNQEKIDSYIRTPASEYILSQYREGLKENSKDRVSILIGPYGKGKSHLLLVLLDELEKREKPYLPVLISYGQQSLKNEFLLGLQKALQRAGIDDIKPDSYYSEAIRLIELWKHEYPETYEKFVQMLSSQKIFVENLYEGLEKQSEEMLHIFRKIYPKLTAGGEFAPLVQTDLKENFISMNRQLSDKYGYAGMFIVFDEFGKYLEGHSKEGYENDMKVLQDMCELAVKSGEPQLHITLVTHKSIKEYGNTVDKRILDGFMGIEGRIREIFYVDSLQNHYEIIANVVKKDETLFQQEIEKHPELRFYEQMEENYQLPLFSTMFTKEEFYRIVGKGCYPLTPIAAYLLLQISQRVAQNERTIFTFLAGSDEKGLENQIRTQKTNAFFGADILFDYFENIFREEVSNTEIHREWMKAVYALEQVQESAQKEFIKTLTIITMLHKDNELPPADIHIRLAMGMKEEEYEKTKQSLIEKKLLLYRKRRGLCQLKNNIGIDVEEEIKQICDTMDVTHHIRQLLNKVWDIPYELPKRYNSCYKMTRFFFYEFIYPEDFFSFQSFSYLFEEKFSDGKILLLLKHAEDKKIYEKLVSVGDKRIVVINPHWDFHEEALLKKYEAVLKCKQNEDFVNHNNVVLGELEWYEQEIYFEINSLLESMYLPENGHCKVYSLCKNAEYEQEEIQEEIIDARAFNRLLSTICDVWYGEAPKVNHELINRNDVSVQIKNARRKLLEDILHHRDMSSYEKGTSAQASIYRAVFQQTGKDRGVREMEGIIGRFLKGAWGTRKSFDNLYEQLQGKGYGVRKGIIPLYLAKELVRMEDMPICYCKGHEVELKALILENIEENPKEYELLIEQSTIDKQNYISDLCEIFGADQKDVQKHTYGKNRDTEAFFTNEKVNDLVEQMLNWYRSLPGFTCSYRKGLSDAQLRFRNLLKGQDKNARELVFEQFLKVFETEDYKQAVLQIKETKQILDSHMDNVYREMGILVKQVFDASPNDDMHNILCSWRRRQEQYLSHNICSDALSRIALLAEQINGYEDNVILSELSKIILDVYPENWGESSCEVFIQKLKEVLEKIQPQDYMKQEDGKKLRFVGSDGQVIEKYYEDILQEGTEIFLENAIDDVLEEFGDTVDNTGKVAILVRMLEKVIRGHV